MMGRHRPRARARARDPRRPRSARTAALPCRAVPLLAVLLAALPLTSRGQDTSTEEPVDDARLERLDYSGLWPFWSREVFEDRTTRTTAALGLWRSEVRPSRARHHRLFPLWSYERRTEDGGEDRRLVVPPLLWAHRRAPTAGHDAVLPLFAHWWTEASSHTMLWPLWHHSREPAPSGWRFVPVLAQWRELPDDEGRTETRFRVGIPRVLDAVQTAATARRSSVTALTLLPWGDETTTGLSLAKWSSGDEGYESHLFPLFAAGALRGAADEPYESWLITLLWGQWRTDSERGFVAPPLLSAVRRGDERLAVDAIFPLGRFERAPLRDELRILPFWWEGETRRSSAADVAAEPPVGLPEGVAPETAEETGAATIPGPTPAPPGIEPRFAWRFASVFWGRTKSWRDGSPPRVDDWYPLALARWSSLGGAPGEHHFDLLFPLIHSRREGDEESFRLLPFFDRSTKGSRESLGIGGVLFRRSVDPDADTSSHWVLAPLIHASRDPQGSTSWALPLWFHRERETADRRSDLTVATPLYVSFARWSRAAPDASWTPTRRELHLWPLWGRSERGELVSDARAVTHHLLFPFFRSTLRTGGPDPARPEREIWAPWPLVRYRGDLRSWDGHIFPLLFTEHSPERSRTLVFPLWSHASGERSGNFADALALARWQSHDDLRRFRLHPWLFEWRRTETDLRVRGPLWWFLWSERPQGWWFHCAPFGFGESRRGDARLGIFPLWYSRTTTAPRVDDSSLLRYLFIINRHRSEEERRWSVLWKAFEYAADTAGGHDFRILHRLVVHRDVEGQHERVFNPFYSSYRDERTGVRRLRILGFIWREDVADGRRTRRLFGVPLD